MSVCPFCGNENNDGNTFCVFCGKPLAQKLAAMNPAPLPTSNEATQQFPVPPVPVAFAPAGTAASAVPENPAAAKKKRGRLIALISIAAVFVIAIIAVIVINNTASSPSAAVSDYLGALSSGDYSKAARLVDPGIEYPQRAALASGVATDADQRIQNVQIGSPQRASGSELSDKGISDGQTYFKVTYSIDGQTASDHIGVKYEGKKWLFIDSWRVAKPMLHWVSFDVPSGISSDILVNGVKVNLKQAENTKGQVAFYPGKYSITLPKSQWYTASTLTLNTAEVNDGLSSSDMNDNGEDVISVKPSEKLASAINDAVKKKIDGCVSSSALNPQGCDFLSGSTFEDSTYAYTSISRAITNDYKVTVNLGKNTFSTDEIDEKITYSWRFDSDSDWTPSDSSETGYATGTWTIKNGQPVVDVELTQTDPSQDE